MNIVLITVIVSILIVFQILSIWIIMHYKNKCKKLNFKINTVLENQKVVRKNIAADLHNGMSGDLNAIRNYVIVLAKNELADASKNSLNEIKIGIDEAIHFNRNLSHKLIPPHLEKLGLLVALKDYFERQKLNSSIQLELDCSEDDLPLEYSKAYEIYSIIYEFIANSKINKSTFCKLTIKQQKNGLIFDLINDGSRLYNYDLTIDKNRSDWQYLQSQINLINGTVCKVQVEKGNHIKIQLKK